MNVVKITLPVKTVKQLFAAEGYLQLGMPEYALGELASIDDPAPVEASVEFLSGEAFRQQERYDEAVKSLERAAQLIPAPYNKVVWLSLSDCFRRRGEEELANIAAMFADGDTDYSDAEAAAFEFDLDELEFEERLFFDDGDEAFDDGDEGDVPPPWHDRWA